MTFHAETRPEVKRRVLPHESRVTESLDMLSTVDQSITENLETFISLLAEVPEHRFSFLLWSMTKFPSRTKLIQK